MKKSLVYLLLILFVVGLAGSCSSALALANTSSGIDMTNDSGQIVPTIDVSMSDVVAFDISKDQYTDDCSGFIADLIAAGYTVATVDIGQGIPGNVKKIVILGARGGGGMVGSYSAAEGSLLEDWVSNGGELMILGEWGGFGDDTEELIKAFGVIPQKNQVTDPTDYDIHDYWVIYQSDNFAAHPVFTGATATEHLSGESFEVAGGAIIIADADATPSGAIVAVALTWGSGRVAIFGDYDWVCDYGTTNGYLKEDNAKVAMNTIYWLNGRPPPGVPEFELAIPLMTSIVAALYLAISKRTYKK